MPPPRVTRSLLGTNMNGPRAPLLVRRRRSLLVERKMQPIVRMMLVSALFRFGYTLWLRSEDPVEAKLPVCDARTLHFTQRRRWVEGWGSMRRA